MGLLQKLAFFSFSGHLSGGKDAKNPLIAHFFDIFRTACLVTWGYVT